MTRRNFNPDWAEPPGATIASILALKSMNSRQFAAQTSMAEEVVFALISGEKAISRELAEMLAKHLGSTASFWMSREKQYRDQSVLKPEASGDELRVWSQSLPVADMVKLGWIKPSSLRARAASCLEFFGVADLRAWERNYSNLLEQVAFKTSSSFDSNPSSVVAWLRYGELRAQEIECAEWSSTRFQQAMNDIRTLTRISSPPDFIPKLKEVCAKSGVALVIARAPKGCAVSGATRFLSPKKAILMLSLRHRTDDHFWFSFFHEAGHLVLHEKDSLFVDGIGVDVSEREKEADEFALEALIPIQKRALLDAVDLDYRSIIRVARKMGVSRGIVVGQLQHRGRIGFDKFNYLKERLYWGEPS